MEPQNLEAAKEEARRSNWTQVLPTSYKESEDEIPNIPSTSVQHQNTGHLAMMNWDEIMEEPQVSIDDDYTTAESNRFDEDGDDLTYEDEGRAMEMSEFGYVQSRVTRLLKNDKADFKSMGERKIQVNLSFISDKASQDRVKKILESVIKKYTSIPGHVETDSVDPLGIYTFNVTNPYLSPKSTSSDEPSVAKDIVEDVDTEGPSTGNDLIESLMKGIQLTPKVPGLPKKILKYGDYGLIKENLYRVIRNNPGKDPRETIEIALKLSGHYKKVFNLYKY